MPPSASYCRASSATCSTLASACSPAGRSTSADVRARRVQQLLDGVGDRHDSCAGVQLLQELERLSDRLQVRDGSRARA